MHTFVASPRETAPQLASLRDTTHQHLRCQTVQAVAVPLKLLLLCLWAQPQPFLAQQASLTNIKTM